jgi:asparagine synthase (glutamine-hydrolysing)
MCGIAGILTSTDWTESNSEAIARLCRALKHRGPDDFGIWIDEAAGVGLAHTRLSILDLSPAGHQPMRSQEGRFTITFNGEIYNFRELRAELEKLGDSFHTGSDTEVLLRLYERYGSSMLSKLRGMFAFCIWDQKEHRGFLARDPFGVKPLYFSDACGTLAFASELRALRSSGLISSAINNEAAEAFFETGSVPEPMTLLKGATMLEAGTWMEWHQGKVSKHGYWSPHFDQPKDHQDPVAVTRAALIDSVRAHFVSDVPVGIFLSGGIDSTALVALAREIGISNLSTFSVGSSDPILDESNLAKQTASHFKSNHIEAKIEDLSAQSMLGGFLKSIDQPTIDGLNTYIVSSLANRNGMKVVLSGLGADEIFGGYPSFQKVPQLAAFAKLIHTLPPAARLAGRILETQAPTSKLRRMGSYLQKSPTISNTTGAIRSLFSRHEAVVLSSRYQPESNGSKTHTTLEGMVSLDPNDQISEWELTRYMRNQLLRDSDVMSMAHGLELRVPFVDKNLFENVSQIRPSTRLHRGKKLLLDAVPEIPEWVLNQPKKGFVLPFDRWLFEEHRTKFSKLAKEMPSKSPTWHQIWAVFIFEHWLSA